MIARFLGNYLLLLGLAILALAIAGKMNWVLNISVAGIGALAVIVGSYASYKRMIDRGVADQDGTDQPDQIDKIEDPHDLYSEETETPKPTIREKASYIKNSFAPFRLMGYLVLVFGFFLLETNGRFEPIAYLLGLLFVPISAIVFWWQNRK